jgi:hypothetical protein
MLRFVAGTASRRTPMTDTTTNFDPIPRLQKISTIIKESGADIFYAPTTVAYDIECAIKEIERMRAERDEARRRTNSILTEIDCRIEHGAESNGHLEAIRNLFKESNDE